MPATLTGAMAIGAAIVALFAAACVVPGFARSGIWRDAITDDA